jgi:hypothetical protein
MRSLRRFLNRLFNSATRRAQEERLREEIEEHIELQTAENLRAGLSPVEARRATWSLVRWAGKKPQSIPNVSLGLTTNRSVIWISSLILAAAFHCNLTATLSVSGLI